MVTTVDRATLAADVYTTAPDLTPVAGTDWTRVSSFVREEKGVRNHCLC